MAVGNKDTPAIGGDYTLQYVDLQGLDSRKTYLVRKWSADTAVGCTEKMQASACATTWLPPLVDGEGGGGSNGVGAPHLNLDRQNQSSYAWSAEHQIMCYSCRFLLGPPCTLHLAIVLISGWRRINTTAQFTHELWGIYPILGEGFALLGELDKYVGVSETRFGGTAATGGNWGVTVTPVPAPFSHTHLPPSLPPPLLSSPSPSPSL